jgi:hypothetical protein
MSELGTSGIEVPEPRERSAIDRFLIEGLRQEHRRRAAAETRRSGRRAKRRAVLTMVHNEAVFLPIWLRYYSRFFSPNDIYVLDHETDDGSTERGDFVRIPVRHESVDHTWMVRTIEGHQHELLESYDAVLTTDVDEIVAPAPERGTLADYIDELDADFVNCLGYELIHLVDREPPIDSERPILEQRGYWFRNHAYNKPALATEPSRWIPGFHTREDGRVDIDPDLCLIHLHRMDYAICLARHRYRRRRQWNERDLAEKWASHNLIVDEAEFARWFYEENSFDDQELVVEPIPASWRALF